MGKNDDDSQEHEAHQVFDLQDTHSDYFEKAHDFSESEQRDNGDAQADRDR